MASTDPESGLRNGSRTHEPEHVRRGDADVTALLARLGDDVVRLVDGKLGLIKLDVEEQIRGVATRAVAAVVVAVGVTLAAAGLAFGVAALLPASLDPLLARACAFALVGAVGIGAGVVVLKRGNGVRRG